MSSTAGGGSTGTSSVDPATARSFATFSDRTPGKPGIELSALDEVPAPNCSTACSEPRRAVRTEEALLSHTGGIPIFMEEVVGRLTDTGGLIGRARAYTLTIAPRGTSASRFRCKASSPPLDALPRRQARAAIRGRAGQRSPRAC